MRSLTVPANWDLKQLNLFVAQQENFLRGPLVGMRSEGDYTVLMIDDESADKPPENTVIAIGGQPIGATIIFSGQIYVENSLVTAAAYRPAHTISPRPRSAPLSPQFEREIGADLMREFAAGGTPLSEAGFAGVCAALGVGAPELWTVMSVETTGCGFLPDRRPQILFERHVFSRLTSGQFDAQHPDISNRVPGGYGRAGTYQYNRLAEAVQLDRAAALQSTSWGLGQVLGQNFRTAGFSDVESMTQAMVASEDDQLRAMANTLEAHDWHKPLAAHDWTSFARQYHGPAFATRYDTVFSGTFARFSTEGLPDLDVRRVQILLMYKGFSPGAIDGFVGSNTTRAIKDFQRSIGKAGTGQIDPTLTDALLRE